MISVILTVYNKEKYLYETINSILSQNFKEFELIIINDGSTDNSISIINEFNDSRIYVISTKNNGISKARNLGISLAKMDYIAFIDADDYWLPNHLETHKNLILDYKNASFYCTRYKIIKDKFNYFPKYNISDENFRGIVENFFKVSFPNCIAWTSCVVVRKDIFSKIGMFDENILMGAGEDTDMWFRIAIKYSVALDLTYTCNYNLIGFNHLSYTKTNNRTFSLWNKFYDDEKQNNWLKKNIDLQRASIAISYKKANNKEKFKYYYDELKLFNLNWKVIILLNLNFVFLIFLSKIKYKIEIKFGKINILK